MNHTFKTLLDITEEHEELKDLDMIYTIDKIAKNYKHIVNEKEIKGIKKARETDFEFEYLGNTKRNIGNKHETLNSYKNKNTNEIITVPFQHNHKDIYLKEKYNELTELLKDYVHRSTPKGLSQKIKEKIMPYHKTNEGMQKFIEIKSTIEKIAYR
jgi:hypothetical protein